jgi:hypothetical protein
MIDWNLVLLILACAVILGIILGIPVVEAISSHGDDIKLA